MNCKSSYIYTRQLILFTLYVAGCTGILTLALCLTVQNGELTGGVFINTSTQTSRKNTFQFKFTKQDSFFVVHWMILGSCANRYACLFFLFTDYSIRVNIPLPFFQNLCGNCVEVNLWCGHQGSQSRVCFAISESYGGIITWSHPRSSLG